MSATGLLNLSRRGFIASLGLASGTVLLGLAPQAAFAESAVADEEAAQFGAMLAIAPDGVVSLIVPSSELGQGTQEALARMVAEELDCDFARMEVRLPWADRAFINPIAQKQMTANSMTVVGYYAAMRRLGATTRAMLLEAAAAQLGVAVDALSTRSGTIVHAASSRSLGFGDVAAAAAHLPVPGNVALKQPSDFTVIGGKSLRKDLQAKVTGTAQFGIDVHEEGMLTASLALAPHPKAQFTVEGIEAARAMPGVVAVVPVTGGMAVLADRFWRAKSAAEKLQLTVTSSPIAGLDDASLSARLDAAFDEVAPKPFPKLDISTFPPRIIMADLEALDAAFTSAERVIEAVYEVPHLAHATLEPLVCAARLDSEGLLIRGPLQDPETSRILGAKLSGLPLEQVRVEVTYVGGGFGRKWGTDFVGVAVEAARGAPGRLVKTIWTREQDMAGDQFRPAYKARSRAAIDGAGKVTALHSRVAGQSIMAYHGRKGMHGMEDMGDLTAAGQLIYEAYNPEKLIEYHELDLAVPVGFWRSVSMSQNAFFAESFVDEIARETGRDPLELRLELLDGHPRITPVLKRAAEMIGYGQPREPGIGRGIAFSYAQSNFCAIGFEVGLDDTLLSLRRIACACDCGLMIDPASVEGQVTGGIVFGLQAALWGEVKFENGEPTARNFTDYRMPMMMEVPPIEVALMPGSDEPGNVGEASTPVVAPALANAIVDAGGPRIRALPIARTLTI